MQKKKPEQQPWIWSSVGIFPPNREDTCIEVAPDWPWVCAAARLGGHYNTENTAVSSYNRCPWFSVFLKFQQRLQYDHGKKKKNSWTRGRKIVEGVKWMVCPGGLSNWLVHLWCHRAPLGEFNIRKIYWFFLHPGSVTEWLSPFGSGQHINHTEPSLPRDSCNCLQQN